MRASTSKNKKLQTSLQQVHILTKIFRAPYQGLLNFTLRMVFLEAQLPIKFECKLVSSEHEKHHTQHIFLETS